jgi:pyruvate/2-oxoglutarate dehydrogenase complex dihydrolipoamide dehydrogenase (E3) component
VGGGIAGMQAAITAARKGHHVTIMEKADSLGGQMIIAGVPPHKEILHKALKWFVDEVERLGVDVKLSTEADLKTLQAFNPDVVLVAIGSIPSVPSIPGIDKAIDSWKILNDTSLIPSGKKIVVIGGGIVGCETAHLIAENKNQVTIIEMLPELCRGQEPLHRGFLDEALKNAKVQIEINACTLKVDKNNVQYRNAAGEVCDAPCDMIVVATGQKTIAANLVQSIKDLGIKTYSVGDATATGNLRTATRSAFDIANIL